jgi:ABC-type transport system involved in multi-copper enzyme maturation permease subunit
MLSYIKSEFYRLLHNKWSYLFIIICSGLLISANVVLTAVKLNEPDFPYAVTEFSLSFFYTSFSVIFLLCIMVASMVFGSEHSNHTMKNSISYGISRGYIYFGKLAVEIIYSVIAFVIITGVDIASAYLLLENSGTLYLELLLRTCFTAFPLFLFALAATNCFAFLLESTGAGIAAVVGLLVALPQVTNVLGMKFDIFRMLAKILPWNMINSIGFEGDPPKFMLPWEGAAGYYNYWIIGIAEMLLITVIGYMTFKKKEVK